MENMEFGTLNFGATNFIGVYLLPEVIAKFHDIYPNITINMVINSSKNIFEMLQKNQLEFFLNMDFILIKNYILVIRRQSKSR
ncbi:MAG: LysR substrate-binding domain-containing protein [Acetivibrio ethanolgignens]